MKKLPALKMTYQVGSKITNMTAKKIKKMVFDEAFRSLKESMQEVSKTYTARIRSDAKNAFASSNPNFFNTFRSNIYSKRKDILPTVEHFSKIKYYDIFAKGGLIKSTNKKLIIPFGDKGRNSKTSQQKLRLRIDELFRQKSAFIKKYNNYSIIFAKLTKGSSKYLTKEKKRFKGERGLKSLRTKDSHVIPIAILYDTVRIKKKLDFKTKYMKKEIRDIHNLQMKKYVPPRII